MVETNRRPALAAAPADVANALTDPERAVLAIAQARPELLSPQDAITIVMRSRSEARPVASYLRTRIEEPVLLRVIANELGIAFVDMNDPETELVFNASLVSNIDLGLLVRSSALPLERLDGTIVVAFANPRAHQDTLSVLRAEYTQGFDVAIGLPDQISSRLLAAGAPALVSSGGGAATVEVSEMSDDDATVVEWTDTMLARAHAERASDVSLRYDQLSVNASAELVLRWRVDGAWMSQPLPTHLRGREREIIGSLLARCDTTNPSDLRMPQDGAFAFDVLGARRVDARLGMVPQLHGPGITLRLLDPLNVNRTLDEMGFAAGPLASMRKAIHSSQGMIFVIGPTGSGKSTTLYGMLYEVDTDTRNVLTVEDPVEYRMSGIGQTQVRSGLGAEKSLTFSKVLRSFMRMAPDVILVGEVRDEETASTAVHAALTGHLVMSTIHANSALGVFQRLEEMDIEPYLAAEAMVLAVSQRLLRKVHTCADRREPTTGEVAFLERNRLVVPELVSVPRKGGCAGCREKGYLGRIPVVEILEPSAAVRDAIAAKASTTELREAAAQGGWLRILDDAHQHVQAGTVPVSELSRVLDGSG